VFRKQHGKSIEGKESLCRVAWSGESSALPQARAGRATLPAGVTWMLAKGEHRRRKFPTISDS